MPLDLTIVTPQGPRYQGAVESVVLPGTEGYFGVLDGHEPFLTGLQIGVMEVEHADTTLHAALSTGYANVSADAVTVMVRVATASLPPISGAESVNCSK